MDIDLREQPGRIDMNRTTIRKLLVAQAKSAEGSLKFKRERTASILLAGAAILTAGPVTGGRLTKLFWG
jgi:hypothetical protein